MTARCVMVVGTSSGAGKSFLVTALCRWYARLGLKVAPFKAQNMSNNARVVAGGEIGSAQFFQALAARSVPDVRMNPLLLKPERDTRSQVVLLGQVNAFLTEMPWHQRSAHVWPQVCAALDSLRADHDVVVIEGAGSPAEINLQHSDIVNLRVAEHAAARCVLVTDIDRGGAFAHLYGTWMLLPPAQRRLLSGFVLNKFRGDARLLAPAPADLQELTGVPTVATLPMWRHHGLPEEDGVFDDSPSALVTSADGVKAPITIAVVAYPRISNLDEFQVLRNLPGVRLLWARTATSLAGLSASDWIILPGSKQTSGDLAWLRASSMDAAITAHARRGGPVLGICGGLQMLGEAIVDPLGVEASPDDPLAGNAPGLGLLPLVTRFDPDKTVRNGRWLLSRLEDLPAPWSALAGAQVQGYEIHNGQTVRHAGLAAPIDVVPGLAWCNAAGNVMGLYLHGLFENADVLRRLFGHTAPTLETVFDGLADYVDRHFEAGFLRGLIE